MINRDAVIEGSHLRAMPQRRKCNVLIRTKFDLSHDMTEVDCFQSATITRDINEIFSVGF